VRWIAETREWQRHCRGTAGLITGCSGDRTREIQCDGVLVELYRAVRLYVNFFQPSMKLKTKTRTGSKVHRSYHAARTPHQRLQTSGVLATVKTDHLVQIYQALDPVRLLKQVARLQDALWQHGVQSPSVMAAGPTDEVRSLIARFNADECMPDGGVGSDNVGAVAQLPTPGSMATDRKRKYRRTSRSLGPRTYRTRRDPFEDVREEVHQWYLDTPDLPAKSLLQRLQETYPGKYPDGLLRTLQRRVQECAQRQF